MSVFNESQNSESSLVNNSSILWSSGNRWKNLVLESHSFDKCSQIDLLDKRQSLIIGMPTLIDTQQNAKKDIYKTNSGGNVCLYSMERPKRVCLHHQQALLIILSLDVFSLKVELIENHQFEDEQLKYIGMALQAEAQSGYLSGQIYGESLCTALSVHLLNYYSSKKTPVPKQKGGMSPCQLNRVIGFINNNLQEDLSLTNLAEIAGLSKYRFAHNFKKTTGSAPHQFVIQTRLERAKQMLRKTDKTITEITYSVGYSCPSRFTLSFHKEIGMTPTAYRKLFS